MLKWLNDPEEGWASAQAGDDGDAADGFRQHIEYFAEALEGQIKLGRMPGDLLDVLTDFALGSPAICVMRAIRRIAKGLPEVTPSVLAAASRVGNGLRALFNQPDVTALFAQTTSACRTGGACLITASMEIFRRFSMSTRTFSKRLPGSPRTGDGNRQRRRRRNDRSTVTARLVAARG